MSSQDSESNDQAENTSLVLQNKEMRQLMSLTLDTKLTKAALLKLNISEAIELASQNIDQMEIRVYGNIVFAISKGILKTLNAITIDLKETIELMRKGVKVAKDSEQQIARAVKGLKNSKVALPSSTSDSRVEESSISTAEKARHVASKEKITFSDKFTPNRFPDVDFGQDSFQSQSNFRAVLDGMDVPPDFVSEIGGQPLSVIPSGTKFPAFEVSTPSRFGDFVSPMKQQQAYSNLDGYLESMKKGEQIIFQEGSSDEDEEETETQRRARGEARRRRRTRRAEPEVELQARWDYDETTKLEKIDEERQVTDAALFVQKVQAPFVQPIEKRLAVNLDHIIAPFTMDNLIQFNQKLKALKDQQVARGPMTAERNQQFTDTFDEYAYPQEEQPLFPGQGSDFREQSRLFGYEEEQPIEPQERGLLEPSRIEQISLQLDREFIEDKKTASETVSAQKGKKDKSVSFLKLAEKESRSAKSNMFYELLNLAKQSKVSITQQRPFADIEIAVL